MTAGEGLLNESRILIHHVTIDGDVARVSFYGPGNYHGAGPTVELTRDRRGWTVKGYVNVPEPEPDDDHLPP